MRAAFYERNGPAREVLQVGEVATPQPRDGEVLVRVHVSGVNPSDVKTRGGSSGRALSGRVVPHNDGAGVIEAVGPGVDRKRVGERVWLHNTVWDRSLGTAAEYVVAPGENAVHLPETVSFEEGACLGVPLLTAYHGVMVAGPVEGKSVFVTGGAGAVGHYAVQIAKAKGATVIATVSSAKKAEAARAAGADHVLNYREEDLAAAVSRITGGRGADVYVEVNLSANAMQLPNLLASGAAVTIYGSDEADTVIPSRALRVKQTRMYFYNVYALPRAVLEAAKADLAPLLGSGRLQHAIAQRYALDQIVAAHEAVESGSLIGNAVIAIG